MAWSCVEQAAANSSPISHSSFTAWSHRREVGCQPWPGDRHCAQSLHYCWFGSASPEAVIPTGLTEVWFVLWEHLQVCALYFF